jgi:hypothetical protein
MPSKPTRSLDARPGTGDGPASYNSSAGARGSSPDVDLVRVRREGVDTVTGLGGDDSAEHHAANAAHRGGAVVDVAGSTTNRPQRRALTRNASIGDDKPARRRAPSKGTARTARPSGTPKAKTAKPAARKAKTGKVTGHKTGKR